MPRLASLFLPDLAIDRIRRAERIASPPDPIVFPDPGPARSERPFSCPQAPGFRPGARWAREGKDEIVLATPAPGDPLVTADRSGRAVVLAAVDPAARALGLVPGMALTQARLLVPGLELRESDPGGDAAFLARLGLFAARRWTPRAALSGSNGLWLDLTGVSHLFGGERRMGERILEFCARMGLSARLAVAGTLGAAHALACFGPDRLVLAEPGGEAAALAPLPMIALRLDEETLGAARRLGIETVGQLAAMPRGPLRRRFGSRLLDRLDQALGRVSEPLDPILPEEPPSVLLRFVEPIASPEAIAEAMEEAVRRLVEALRGTDLAVRRLSLACLRVDGEVQEVEIGTARATRDGSHLARLLAMKIETIDPGFGIERMWLVATRVEPFGPRAIGIDFESRTSAPDLALLFDRLAGRLGPRRLYRQSAIESDVPERSVARSGLLETPRAWPAWPRPVRLLRPPERIDNVVALLPDQPPRRFTWRGQVHQIVQADGPERIHGEWWKRPAEADAVRDYFRVEDEAGKRFWLFRRGDGVDSRTGDLSWYLHGLFG